MTPATGHGRTLGAVQSNFGTSTTRSTIWSFSEARKGSHFAHGSHERGQGADGRTRSGHVDYPLHNFRGHATLQTHHPWRKAPSHRSRCAFDPLTPRPNDGHWFEGIEQRFVHQTETRNHGMVNTCMPIKRGKCWFLSNLITAVLYHDLD